mmetsp:Transcript_86468/g.231714  ORF Transcript_86468/g.231714 Transcript_86468/m.231714 type:complete len:161 (-) Transcript_86468:1278-1760(-)
MLYQLVTPPASAQQNFGWAQAGSVLDEPTTLLQVVQPLAGRQQRLAIANRLLQLAKDSELGTVLGLGILPDVWHWVQVTPVLVARRLLVSLQGHWFVSGQNSTNLEYEASAGPQEPSRLKSDLDFWKSVTGLQRSDRHLFAKNTPPAPEKEALAIQRRTA